MAASDGRRKNINCCAMSSKLTIWQDRGPVSNKLCIFVEQSVKNGNYQKHIF